MRILLDTSILGYLTHPNRTIRLPIAAWLDDLRTAHRNNFEAFIPEVCDFELRRKLLHLQLKDAQLTEPLRRLDMLASMHTFLPVTREMWLRAARLWATARSQGFSVAPPEALSSDIILAAQALELNAWVCTENKKHLSKFVTTKSMSEIK